MIIRVNERNRHGQKMIEIVDRSSGKSAEIVIFPNGEVIETGDRKLIKIFRTKKLNY